MNLTKLFELQKVLDERIVREKGLEGRDTLPKKILALQVELGECANEWRGFKFWSEDKEPRTCVINREGETANEYYKNPLLEEYVDCLHFILSLGNELEAHGLDVHGHYSESPNFNIGTRTKKTDVGDQFRKVFRMTALFDMSPRIDSYVEVSSEFMTLGDALGFTEELIESAYYDKNEINHARQAEGY